MYTHLVKKEIITLEKLIELMAINPLNRFGIKSRMDFSVWDLEKEYTVDPSQFLSKGRATPFENEKLFGVNLITVCDGKVVYRNENI